MVLRIYRLCDLLLLVHKNTLSTFKLDTKYVALFITFLFEGLLYNITFNWVQFLLISIFIMSKEKIDIFKINDITVFQRI